MDDAKTTSTLGYLISSATLNLQQVLNVLGMTADDFRNKSKRIFWLRTYPEVCKNIGLKDYDGSDAYSHEVGNGEQYGKEGRFFSIIPFAIDIGDDDEPFFWPEFVFIEYDRVRIEVGINNIHSSQCGKVLKAVTGYKENQILTYVEACDVLIKIKKEMTKNKKYYEKYLKY